MVIGERIPPGKKGRQRRIETDQPQGRNYRITAPPLFANPPRDKSTAMRQTNQNFCSTLITNPSQFVGQIQRDNSCGSVICHLHGLHLLGGAGHVNRGSVVSESRRRHQLWFHRRKVVILDSLIQDFRRVSEIFQIKKI